MKPLDLIVYVDVWGDYEVANASNFFAREYNTLEVGRIPRSAFYSLDECAQFVRDEIVEDEPINVYAL